MSWEQWLKEWHTSSRADRLIWIAARAGIDLDSITWTACQMARTALYRVLGGDARPQQAIELAESWCRGRVSTDAVRSEMIEMHQIVVSLSRYAHTLEMQTACSTRWGGHAAYVDYLLGASHAARAAYLACCTIGDPYLGVNVADAAALTAPYGVERALAHLATIVRKEISYSDVLHAIEHQRKPVNTLRSHAS